ncbi:hypothetical protein P3342_009114 [Pyrenophora teres f. teres]|nr:hypothetical protein P3342_009114 [Pyrenophora teres f. teres]
MPAQSTVPLASVCLEAQLNLVCDNNVPERSGVLCRFQAANGKIQDGAAQIDSLAQAKVN